jgi:FkbM family methyltransferase
MRLYFDSELSRLIYCEDFELKERRFIYSFLRPADVFIDIGANIGLFTLIAGQKVGRSGEVYAFEPCSKAYNRLLDNIQLNHLNNVSCRRAAISDQNGQAFITIPTDGYDAWASLGKPSAGSLFMQEQVDTLTLDYFFREHNLIGRVAMIKIDAEGWETHVLKGGIEILSRPDAPLLQVEFTDENMRSANSSCFELYHLLENLGYKMYTYDQQSRNLIPETMMGSYPYLNLIAVKSIERLSGRLNKK